MVYTPFRHQLTGAEFLLSRKRCALWDEQGLGKTGTVLTAWSWARDLTGDGRLLVIAPAAVLYNWHAEVALWTSGNRAQVLKGSRDTVDPDADVVIVSDALISGGWIREQLTGCEPWLAIAVDEAHRLKNPTAQRTRAFYTGDAPLCTHSAHTWLLTGTPLPNNASELWSALHGLAPETILDEHGTPMSEAKFTRRFTAGRPTRFGWKITANKNAPELRERLKGFALRRLKKDVLDLPPKRFGTLSLETPALPKDIAGLADELGPEVAALLSESGDALEAFDRIEALVGDDAFARWRRWCGYAKVQPTLDVTLPELVDDPAKHLVVFAVHSDVIARLEAGYVKKLGQNAVATITGAVSPQKRFDLVRRFQDPADPLRVIVGNITAAGVGITLTAAADVVFAELSFVPGENAQAVDRCHRIGQHVSVLVRFVALAGTVDEAVVRALQKKTAMISEVLD